MPGPHMELDEAIARNGESTNFIRIRRITFARWGHGHEPGLIGNGTEALRTLLMASDGVKLPSSINERHDVKAGSAGTELKLSIVRAKARPIGTSKDDLAKRSKGFWGNGLGGEELQGRRR